MTTLSVALAQLNVRKGEPRINWTHAQELIAQAATRGVDVVVLPELWDAGMAYDRGREIASTLSGGLFAQVAALSRQTNLHIFGSMYEKRGVGVYNTCAVISPRSGVTGAYRKMHLFPLASEDKWLTPGEAPLSVDLPWGRTGFGICYDLRFPELFRRYADDGTQVVILPASWPHPRLEHYRTLLRARAIENQCYMIAVNRTGTDADDGTQYFGHSCVIDPWGEVALEVGEQEGLYTVTLDLDLVAEVRRKIPALQGRVL
ncbi:carbon-nitrogen family hydrolase [Aggregatilinea lenta]|uniref:carbon-nitrogen family hydrolase n=1 Tax=Aggregatilinea lenta TaxID=913108 RepID=UPI000E5B4319|nr:carbon-nitrogen family hydrolase [Aggregatilinea lenta]